LQCWAVKTVQNLNATINHATISLPLPSMQYAETIESGATCGIESRIENGLEIALSRVNPSISTRKKKYEGNNKNKFTKTL
jgi:hypothetical protein